MYQKNETLDQLCLAVVFGLQASLSFIMLNISSA